MFLQLEREGREGSDMGFRGGGRRMFPLQEEREGGKGGWKGGVRKRLSGVNI